MLQSLSIKNVVLIKSLELSFNSGFTVLTGETGAGKSILLDALQLVMGERADNSLIRLGESEASVCATFSNVSGLGADKVLKDLSLFDENNDNVILRRTLSKEGSARAFVNDRAVTLSTLRLISSYFIDIHGQFDSILESTSHREILDNFIIDNPMGDCDAISPQENVFVTYEELKRAKNDLEKALNTSQEKAQRIVFLEMAIDELNKLAYKSGEEIDLLRLRSQASHISKLRDYTSDIMTNLYEKNGVISLLNSTVRAFEKIDALSPIFPELSEQVRNAYFSINEYESEIRKFCFSPQEYNLEDIDGRMHALKQMARKFAIDISELDIFYKKLLDELNSLAVDEFGLEKLKADYSSAREHYLQAAQTLASHRRKVAGIISDGVAGALKSLKLEKASIIFEFHQLEEDNWGSYGHERVALMVKTNDGSEAGPIAKVASGGERSRIVLALKSVIHNSKRSGFTQIFDEIDAGMGGAAASSVGSMLKGLSVDQQILCISHAPQVASYADDHLMVEKKHHNGATTTSVRHLNVDEKLEEIARMLSGDVITREARSAASTLCMAINT